MKTFGALTLAAALAGAPPWVRAADPTETTEFGCPAPPPASELPGASRAAATAISGEVTQFNFGPDFEIDSFLLGNDVLVTLPPSLEGALRSLLRPGDIVQLSGFVQPPIGGLHRIELVCLLAGGKKHWVAQPGQGAQYQGSGAVSQINYDRAGRVNGFIFGDGVLAKTPPDLDGIVRSMVAPRELVTVTGISHPAFEGPVVVEVASINGKTIADLGNAALHKKEAPPATEGRQGAGMPWPPMPVNSTPSPPAAGSVPAQQTTGSYDQPN
jgi:hypothetical protein